MQTLVGKRAKSVANPEVADGVINILGYFEKQTDDCADTVVLRIDEIEETSTDTYVSVGKKSLKDHENIEISTDTYVSVANIKDFLYLYGKVNTLYKKKADKVKPVNRLHKKGLEPEGVENWK